MIQVLKGSSQFQSFIKKISQSVLASILLTALATMPALSASAASTGTTATVSITKSGGWLETAYVEWSPVAGAAGYNVYYKSANASDSQYTKIDAPLVRVYPSYVRADVLGLAEGNYVVKVVPVINGSESASSAANTQTLAVKAHTREGFAFSPQSPSKTASGGYNDDGTVPSNAQIVYVTAATANTVSLAVKTDSKGNKTTATGLSAILQARGKGYDKTPLIIRMIGLIKDSQVTGLNNGNFLAFAGSNNTTRTISNITFEGVGEDAATYGYGFSFKRSMNIELRNVGIMLFGDDGVSMDTDNQNIWVHNNDFFYGKPGSDADQVKGDGTVDMKYNSSYITISYNHFFDSGKTTFSGGATETTTSYVTYHHNWFDHSDSRNPRLKVATCHVYNNYFDGVSGYGVGSTYGTSAFVEGNYFRNTKYPMLISKQGTDVYGGKSGTFSDQPGGIIKAFNNYVEGATRLVYQTQEPVQFDAYLVSSRTEAIPSTVTTVSGPYTYSNFDTASGMYTSTPDSPNTAKTLVTAYAGRVTGGDFKWVFTAAEDTNKEIIPALKQALVDYVSPLVTTPAPAATPAATPVH